MRLCQETPWQNIKESEKSTGYKNQKPVRNSNLFLSVLFCFVYVGFSLLLDSEGR